MAAAEGTRNRNEQSTPRTRKISSILKAPRTSLKATVADNEDGQEEPTQPIEKRKSRRVSFATTNDIKYIRELKNSSPQKGLCQDLDITGSEMQKERVSDTKSVDKQISGMESLLTAPLHVSQHNKENMYRLVDNTDKTIMFCEEDTACMDMTHCHTVFIDNDAAVINETTSHEKTMNNSNFEDFKSTSMSKGAVIQESDMDEFLTSLTQLKTNNCPITSPRSQNAAALSTSTVECSVYSSPCPKLDSKSFLSRLSIGKSEADKENHDGRGYEGQDVASGTSYMKDLSFIGQTMMPEDGNCMDTTRSHAVIIINQQQHRQPMKQDSTKVTRNKSLGIQQNSVLTAKKRLSMFDADDMDMTKSQTVSIDCKKVHLRFNPSLAPSVKHSQSMSASSKTQISSESDYAMDMTANLTVPIKEVTHLPKNDENGMEKFPTLEPVSTVPGHMGTTRNHPGPVGSNDVATELSDTDDMELTRSQTVVIDSKSCTGGMAISSFATGRKSLSFMPSNKTVMFTEEDFGMEMTTPLSVPIDGSGIKATASVPLTKPKPVFSSHRPDTTEMTSNYRGTVSHNPSAAFSTDSDDMELTRIQTVVIDSKSCTGGMAISSFAAGRKSLSFMPSNKTVMFTEEDFGMEMTTPLSVPIDGSGIKATASVPLTKPKPVFSSDRPDTTEMTSNYRGTVSHNLSAAFSTDSDDMELTRSQTVVIDSKNCTGGMAISSFATGRKSLSFMPSNKTVMFTEEDFGMEMTTPLCVPIDESAPLSRSGIKGTASVPPTKPKPVFSSDRPDTTEMTSNYTGTVSHKPSAAFSTDSDDMELTRSQTVVIDSKICTGGMAISSFATGRKSLSFMPSNKTVMFTEEDFGMEMTTPLSVPIDGSGIKGTASVPPTKPKPVFSSDRPDTTEMSSNYRGTVSHNPSAAFSTDSDDMELTRSQTAVIDSKSCTGGMAIPSIATRRKSYSFMPSNKMVMCSENKEGMDMTTTLTATKERTGHIYSGETEEFSKSLAHKMVSFCPGSDNMEDTGTQAAAVTHSVLADKASISGVMEMAQSQTSLADSEICDSTMDRATSLSGKSVVTSTGGIHSFSSSYPSELYVSGSFRSHKVADSAVETVSDVNVATKKRTVTSMEKQELNTNEQVLAPCDQMEVNKDTSGPHELQDEGDKDVSIMDCTEKEDKVMDSTDLPFSSKHEMKSRRISLADLQSKLNNIKDIIATPDVPDSRCRKGPFPEIPADAEPTFESRTFSTNENCGNNQPGFHNAQTTLVDPGDPLLEENDGVKQKANVTAPFNFKCKPQMTRMSFGGFLPKLPQKNKPPVQSRAELMQVNPSESLQTKTVSLSDFYPSNSTPVEDINDEILPEVSSEDDLTETMKGMGHSESQVQEGFPKEELPQTAVDEQQVQNVRQGHKRQSTVNGHEDTQTVQRKMSRSSEPEWNGSIVGVSTENSVSMIIKTLDTPNINNNSTYMRAESTFDTSAQRSSQFQREFDDTTGCELDPHKKLQDGSISMKEFLHMFGIGFVIHQPRQSVLPDHFVLADTACKAEHLLVEKYINRPWQRIYEEDCEKLSKMADKLKSRMCDQNKILKIINPSFWEGVKNYSEEQLQNLGIKLQERQLYFRKKSKETSHEMKLSLYNTLVQNAQRVQQQLKDKIKETDELLDNLDNCVEDLQNELSLMKNEGEQEVGGNSELMHTLEAKQQELERLNTAVSANERQLHVMELERNDSKLQICKLQEETKELKKQMSVLDRVIEWKLAEKSENSIIFSFLYGSIHMEVLLEPCPSEAEQKEKERNKTKQKVKDIRFDLQLNEEKSMCHARLVYKLVNLFIQSESNWLQKYPTRLNLPMLLHNVSLVVGRCHALGDEIDKLRRWGALKFDILDISSEDTHINIVFSSLKVSAKFEVALGVDSDYPASRLQVISFRNIIGNTRLDLLEEVVSAVIPGRNYLTRTVTKLYKTLLC